MGKKKLHFSFKKRSKYFFFEHFKKKHQHFRNEISDSFEILYCRKILCDVRKTKSTVSKIIYYYCKYTDIYTRTHIRTAFDMHEQCGCDHCSIWMDFGCAARLTHFGTLFVFAQMVQIKIKAKGVRSCVFTKCNDIIKWKRVKEQQKAIVLRIEMQITDWVFEWKVKRTRARERERERKQKRKVQIITQRPKA